MQPTTQRTSRRLPRACRCLLRQAIPGQQPATGIIPLRSTASVSAPPPRRPITSLSEEQIFPIHPSTPTVRIGDQATAPRTVRRFLTFLRFPGIIHAQGPLRRSFPAIRMVMDPPVIAPAALASRTGALNTVAGGGGPSGCATGVPADNFVVGGSCKGYAKPSWQKGVPGIPNDGVRDLPDVSLFAANGLWGHYYAFCFSDFENGGTPCEGPPVYWSGAGGTSFSSPIMAGIQALVNQKMGAAQGNPNPVYYKLAASSVASSVFHSITAGRHRSQLLGRHRLLRNRVCRTGPRRPHGLTEMGRFPHPAILTIRLSRLEVAGTLRPDSAAWTPST